MSRPAGVTVSGVFLILISVFTALMGILVYLAQSLAPPPAPSSPFVKTILVITAGMLFSFALWGMLSAIGLFRMRPWARISTLIIGSILVIFCGMSVAMLVFVASQVPEMESSGRGGVIMTIVAGSYSLPMLLGLWWLIYFNRASVKSAFLSGQPQPVEAARPLSIAVIAWHLIAFGVLTPIGIGYRFPALVLGLWLTGWAAAIVYITFAVGQLWIGVGLLRLKPWSLNAAIAVCIYGMVNSVVFAFLPNTSSKMIAAMKGLFQDFSGNAPPMEPVDPTLNAALGVLVMALPLYYLVTRRQKYLDAGSRAVSTN